MAIGLSPNRPKAQYQPQIPQDFPVYKILDEKGFYSDDTLIPAGEMIIWEEEPNPMMQPMNGKAQEAYVAYLEKLDAHGFEWAKSEKKSYVSQAKQYRVSLGLAPTEDLRRAKTLTPMGETPMMGAKQRGPAKARKVILDTAVGTPMMGTLDKNEINKSVDKSIL